MAKYELVYKGGVYDPQMKSAKDHSVGVPLSNIQILGATGQKLTTVTLLTQAGLKEWSVKNGITGPKGDKGDKGKDLDVSKIPHTLIIDGIEGVLETGLVGAAGPAGKDGIIGKDGVAAKPFHIKDKLDNEVAIKALVNPVISDAYLAKDTREIWVFTAKGWLNVGTVQGDKGDKGIQGIQGIQGIIGTTGNTGPQGSTGGSGAKGDKGDKGIIGPQGPTGSQGLRGDRGITGTTGNPGADGRSFQIVGSRPTDVEIQKITGATIGDGYIALDTSHLWGYTPTGWQNLGNLQGPQGHVGATGSQGIQGPKGDTGHEGPQGNTGSQGSKGLKGNTGDRGPIGVSNVAGPQGVTGLQGPQGLKGPTGLTGSRSMTLYFDDGSHETVRVG